MRILLLCIYIAMLAACSKDEPVYRQVPQVTVREGLGDDTLTGLRCTPNPSNAQTSVSFNLTRQQKLHVKVFNAVGYMRYENEAYQAYKGYNIFALDMSGWQAGIYYFQVIVNNSTYNTKIVKTE